MLKDSEIFATCKPATAAGTPSLAPITAPLVRNIAVTADRGFRRILGNAFLNLLGNLAPLLTAAIAVPVLVHRLGEGGFGLFSLLWVILGYFSIFDLGLSRTLTRLVAEYSAVGRAAEIPDLVTTVMCLLAGLGVCGGLLCGGGAWVRMALAGLPNGLAPSDGPLILLVLLIGVPATLIVAGIRGILEGYQDFRRANALRIPAGVALMALPCLFVLVVPSVMAAVAGLFAARLLILALHLMVVRTHLSDLHGRFQRSNIGILFRFGGWLTVSNVVGPVIVYIDRFALAAWMGAAAVGFYTAPFEIVTRLLVIPQALANALFPALTVVQGSDAGHFRHLFVRAVLTCVAVVVPMALIGMLAAAWLLKTWLNPEFAQASSAVMQILLLGFIFNSVAQFPLTALHSQGRARPVALLHLAELPLYFAGLTVLVRNAGLAGAAWAWTLRSVIDCACLFWLARRAIAGGGSAVVSPEPAAGTLEP